MAMELNEDRGIELGNLCPQVIDSIFSRIPLKPLTKLKCVCRAWCKFINDFRRCNPPATNSGLVLLLNLQYYPPFAQELIFIEAQKPCRRWLVDPEDGKFCSTKFSNHDWFKQSNSRLYLIDSCCGLLLYCTNCSQYWTYHVVNPFLGEFLALPQVHEIQRLACASLVLDESYQKNFRIIYTFLEEIDVMRGSMGCQIFSSETREWREIQARISNHCYLLKDGFNIKQLFDHRVFSKGRLYWIWSICMLVYDDGVESFKLIPLPLKEAQIKHNLLDMRSQLLWESDGQIYFCHERDKVISIFKFTMEDGDLLFQDDDYSKACSYWQFYRYVQLQDIIIYPELNHINEDKLLRFKRRGVEPCAFNEDLQLLFLFVPPGRIVGYSLETGELEPVWYCEELIGSTSSSVNVVKPFLFKKSVNHFAS